MPVCESCGHDAVAIQESLSKRIAEQGARIKETSTMLAEAKSRASELEGKVKELSAREEQISIREAEQAGGWALDDRGRKLARWAYEDAHEAVAAEERPSFAEWLKSEAAAADPVLGSYRGAPAVPPSAKAPGPQAAPPRQAPPAPPANGASTPPPRMTLDQINARAKEVMASPLPPAEKATKIAELKVQRDQAAKASPA